MQVKLKSKLAATTSAVALAVGMSVIFAGPAAAMDGQLMCVVATSSHPAQCLEKLMPDVGSGVQPKIVSTSNPGQYNTPSTSGQISVYRSSPAECLQVMNSSGLVETQPCHGNPDEEWSVFPDPGTSAYYDNEGTALCLNDKYFAHVVNAAPCNNGPDERWYP